MTPPSRGAFSAVVRRIPVGRVTTYGTVARLAGKPRAARAVGNIMAEARQPGLPYHRVIAAGGLLGGYGGQIGLKRALLAAEGLTVTRTRVRNFDDKSHVAGLNKSHPNADR